MPPKSKTTKAAASDDYDLYDFDDDVDQQPSGTHYHIEHAASGRSKCKKCKDTIAKGELRIATNSHNNKGGNDFAMTSYMHPICFTIPTRGVLKGVSAEDFVTNHLDDQTSDEILSNETKKQQVIDAIATKPSKNAKTKDGEGGGAGGTNPISKRLEEIKTRMLALPPSEDDDDEEEEEDKKPAAKKAKTSDGTDDAIVAYAKAMKVYSAMKNDDLKSVLRWNLGYGMTGTKDILLLRCLDGHVHGRLARCPTCFHGKLNLKDEDAGATIICKGYYDEDSAQRIPCAYAVPMSSAPRLQPWYATQPTEQQIEEIEAITEAHKALADGKGGVASSSGGSGVPPELVEAAKALVDQWGDADNKTKAQLIVDISTSGAIKLDLPQDEKKARIAVGKMILSNQGAAAVELVELVMKEFGVATAKEEAKAKQKSAMEHACVVPANAGIVQAFQELGDYYFKEGNSNAGLTYKKAITAISSLDYEITAANAMGLGKGKTKLVGIGKSTAEKIHEFYSTGAIQKLVEKRMINS